MKKLIDIRTGQAMYFSARTVKKGKLPKYLVAPSEVYAKKEPEAKLHIKPEVILQVEPPKDVEVRDEEPVIIASPTRAEMIAYLKSAGQKVSFNIRNDKLTERYEDTKQKD